jgi:3-hydroxyacyl-[acyl-carrier-protein] dehydratase
VIDIEKAIPHRPPFLFVDKVISVGDGKIVAEKTLSPDLDFFKGHYPDYPIMPGVLTCEAVIQAGAILLAHELGDTREVGGKKEGAPVLTRIRDARFKNMVRPGDVLTLEANIDEVVGAAYYMEGKAKAGDKMVMTIKFTCVMAPLVKGDSA